MRPYPIAGNWDGTVNDGIGTFDQATGVFYLCVSSAMINPALGCGNTANQTVFAFGNPNDVPLAGHWSKSSNHAGIGIYRSGSGILMFSLRNTIGAGAANYSMVLGMPGDAGIDGDWTSKGYDSPGVFRPSNNTFYLSNQDTNGTVFSDISFL